MKIFISSILLLLSSTCILAHEDPLGDLHPRIKVDGNEFHILFSNNVDNKNYEAVISVNEHGAIILKQPKTEVKKQPQEEEITEAKSEKPTTSIPAIRSFVINKTTYFAGCKEIAKDNPNEKFYKPCLNVIPNYEYEFEPDPTGFCFSAQIDKDYMEKGKSYDFSTKEIDFTYISDGWVDDNIAVFLASARKNLYLCCYYGKDYKEVKFIDLGEIPHIYYFPVSSKITFQKGTFYIAFPQSDKKTGFDQLVLAQIDKNNLVLTKTVLEERMDSNTSIALAAINKKLLIAYHSPSIFLSKDKFSRFLLYNMRDSKIVTIFYDIE